MGDENKSGLAEAVRNIYELEDKVEHLESTITGYEADMRIKH